MTLKEAFRYQNFLSSIFDTIMSNMNSSSACSVTETHLRSKANQDAEDEVVDRTSKRCFDCTVDQLIDVAQFIIKEKESLSIAIADAKYRDCMYMDANVSVNAARRQLQAKLSMLCRIKPDELETTSTGYRFNVEGNQVPYNYKVIRTIKPSLNQHTAGMTSPDSKRFVLAFGNFSRKSWAHVFGLVKGLFIAHSFRK